jgi:hypothetical protein
MRLVFLLPIYLLAGIAKAQPAEFLTRFYFGESYKFEKLLDVETALSPQGCLFLSVHQQHIQFDNYKGGAYRFWLKGDKSFSIIVTPPEAQRTYGDIKLLARGRWACVGGRIFLTYESKHWMTGQGIDIPANERTYITQNVIPRRNFLPFLPDVLAFSHNRLQIAPQASGLSPVSGQWNYANFAKSPEMPLHKWQLTGTSLFRSHVIEQRFYHRACDNTFMLPLSKMMVRKAIN